MAEVSTRVVTIITDIQLNIASYGVYLTSNLLWKMSSQFEVIWLLFVSVNPSPHNRSVCYDSGVLSSLFSLMACFSSKRQSIPFKQNVNFLIKARERYQSGAIMHEALWCLTFSCDYTSACILSWKSLDCCQLNMFSCPH